MTTHVEHAVTEVVPEPEPPPAGEPGESRWREAERVGRLLARRRELELRTRAEGFDD